MPPQPDRPADSGGIRSDAPQIAEGVVGRLVRPPRQPIAGAMIQATSLDSPAKPVPEIAILTNADGHFTWPLRPGSYRLAAVVEGRELAEATVRIEPGRITRLDLQANP